MSSDKFWGDSNLDILIHPDRITEFFPTHDHTRAEKLNAVMRLAVVSGVLVAMYMQDPIWLFNFVCGGVVLTYFVYQNQSQSQGTEMFGGLPTKDRSEYGTDKSGNACVLPTADNPFMNVSFEDYRLDPNRPAACPPDTVINQTTGRTVADETEVNFSQNLFTDVDDLFGTNNSRRQFYTNPSTTIPNNQDEFAQWLYGDARSCKDTKSDCVPYERLQQKRFQFPDETVNPL